MHYQTNVTDTVYRYDGTFQGYLCCVFASFSRKEIPAGIWSPERGQMTFFDSLEIVTDSAKARRVAAGLRRLGSEVQDRVTKGFLSCEPEKELILLRFVRLCFEHGPGTVHMTGDPDVCAAFDLARSVANEAGKYLEFIRFEQRGTMLGTEIHPKNNILPLLRAHFCDRLPDEDFLIFDATHGMALLRQNGRVQYLTMEHYDPHAGEEELDWQTLWKKFFVAVTIEERCDKKRQMNHAPKRYWRDMCEMAPRKG